MFYKLSSCATFFKCLRRFHTHPTSLYCHPLHITPYQTQFLLRPLGVLVVLHHSIQSRPGVGAAARAGVPEGSRASPLFEAAFGNHLGIGRATTDHCPDAIAGSRKSGCGGWSGRGCGGSSGSSPGGSLGGEGAGGGGEVLGRCLRWSIEDVAYVLVDLRVHRQMHAGPGRFTDVVDQWWERLRVVGLSRHS